MFYSISGKYPDSLAAGRFISWFEDKVESTYYKINLEVHSKEVEPLIEKYREMINNYKENKSENNFITTLFTE